MIKTRESTAGSAAVVETVSRRRIVPAEELEKEEQPPQTPDFWPYLEALTAQDWSNHVLYIYRLEPRLVSTSATPAYIDRTFDGTIEMPGTGTMVAVTATRARFFPRRPTRRRYCDAK